MFLFRPILLLGLSFTAAPGVVVSPMSYQRIYFDFLACAEACRITLSAAQIPLQDSQFRFADFRVGATLKRGEQECGWIARVRGIYYPIHCHSCAMLEKLHKVANTRPLPICNPSNPLQALVVDQAIDNIAQDIATHCPKRDNL